MERSYIISVDSIVYYKSEATVIATEIDFPQKPTIHVGKNVKEYFLPSY